MAFADFTLLDGNYFKKADGSGPYVLDAAGEGTLLGSGDSSGTSGADREFVVVGYRAKTAFTGASVGDTVTSARAYDVSGETITQVGATVWYNDTTGAPLASAPNTVNLEPLATGGLTNAQLVAALAGLATQTTLAAVLAKLSAEPATATGQAAIVSALGALGTQTTLAAVLAKLSADPATQTTLATRASEATLATRASEATLAKIARETYSAVTIMQATATGAAPVAFGAQACTSLDLVNASGVDIEYQRGGAGLYMTVPAGTSRLVQGITNASQIGVRRVDQVATNAVVKAEAFAV